MINETVKAARDFLHAHPNQRPVGAGAHKEHVQFQVAKFLDWDVHRVKEALAELAGIEHGAERFFV